MTKSTAATSSGLKCGCLRLDGSVAQDKRVKIVDFFNKTVNCYDESIPNNTTTAPPRRLSIVELQRKNSMCVLLLSAKAGGVGLNLIGANRLIMLDPDWNPATDQQVMGRIYREGQIKQSHIYRFIVGCGVEEAILARQFFKVSEFTTSYQKHKMF